MSRHRMTPKNQFWGTIGLEEIYKGRPIQVIVFIFIELTLIRAAGGVYDFRNFEKVYLCNGLSSNLQISCVPQKTSREYIL